jgi:flagellar motor protein MotB
MRRTLNPWPAVADLFSGLLVATGAGLVMLATWRPPVDEECVRREATRIRNKVKDSLANTLAGKVRECGTEQVCVDVDIRFDRDSDALLGPAKTACESACEAVRKALSGKETEVEIHIEGHADATQVQNPTDELVRDRYNWDKSSARAVSVMLEFARCGVKPPKYRILAVGYADTMRLCDENTRECNDKNRRTTFRIQTNNQEIKARLIREKANC